MCSKINTKLRIEGQFINSQKKGGILPHFIRPADADYYNAKLKK